MTYQLPDSSSQTVFWGDPTGQMDALVIAEHLQAGKKPLVAITVDMPTAEHLENAVRFFLSGKDIPILTLPDWETLPYDSFSPHQDIISTRIKCLFELPKVHHGLLILPLSTALVRLPPKPYILGSTLVIENGQTLDLTNYRRNLEAAGYRCVDTVFEHGEFAIRGSILDIFPTGHHTPYRIDLFDDEVDSIREFDIESQRSSEKVEQINLLPAHEFPLTKESITRFRNQFYELFPNTSRNCPILQDVMNSIASPGLEYYLGLFFDQTATIFDYLADDATLILYGGLHERSEHFWDELNNRYEDLRHDIERPILPPGEIYQRTDEFFGHLKQFPRAEFTGKQPDPKASQSASKQSATDFASLPDISIQPKLADPFVNLKALAKDIPHVVICAETAGRQQVLLDTFKQAGIKLQERNNWKGCLETDSTWSITIAELTKGFIHTEQQFAIIAEPDLYQDRVPQRRRRKRTTESGDNIVQNLTELRVGSPVVHIDHGIGRYKGLETLEVDGQKQEFLLLEYANDAKLYVPVSSLHLISRYTGVNEELVPISKLGTDRWSAAKKSAAEKIKDTAAELLEVYARREANPGFACSRPDESYSAFAAAFPFEETPDQLNAIDAVMKDMIKPSPMDRLVCGDVGFGKTEVAMRAAFLAANSGRQVAVLVPTTLLAQQHFQTFQDRFADTAIQIELISRFRSGSDVDKIKEKLRDGKVDIVVGTHKLLQKDIKFQDLGLLVIDEEHRFGVQQKEKIKALRANIDILAMTATPIPRTLNLSLQGVRDLSIISTPPERRLSVKTFIRERSDSLIKEAVLREILRGGQVFFLHNEVSSIEKEARELEALVPDARVGVAHGQMRERELERVMSDFYHKRFNVLICSTIIETGIDIPSANTILIDRADKFGIAQLHQLRGRVGRSHHQAYAYLLTPPPRTLSSDALKRLEAIGNAQDLGAGFTLATHDLEIRGAGELLGEEQSGHIQNIGYSLYSQLLEAAVKAMQNGEELDLSQPIPHGCDINFRIPALIPDEYLPDVHGRLILYKRIANTDHSEALRDLQVEMIDRFGLLPDPVKNLFRQQSIKLKADKIGITKIDVGIRGGSIEFGHKTQVEPMTLVLLIQKEPARYKLDGGNKLKIQQSLESAEERLQFIENLLQTFSTSSARAQ
ncbi:transcription-repair coupling factor [Hahella sp. CCB-MM4]|uniref:transcription-repair coupling factor n=1 Tax=Hahella sp. (strain CCB-MM4) TaxID=1926491 RepID=UPI000B9B9FBA|nr:transcription-repair coupling factor [Hahella sp. CCB-MM4]OZG73586.1 transcription-repair coupling factor [Hahella sp. CCB-MM4]